MESNPKQSRIALVVILVIAVVVIAITAVLLVNGNSLAPGTTQNESTNSNQTGSQTGEATITFTNTGFSPSQLTVKRGTTVTVVNDSSQTMQFSSDEHPTHQENPEMNLNDLTPGERGSFTANTVGTHSFHDHHDDSKTGTLIVTE